MSHTTRRPTWHLALLHDHEARDNCAPATSLLMVRPDGTRVIPLGDFGARCPYGAACAFLRARLSSRRADRRPGRLHTHDARLARRLARAVRPGRMVGGTVISTRACWPALDQARDALPGGPARWRWLGTEERPAPLARRAA